MKRITFKMQLYISAALILVGNLLSTLLKNGALCNIAWILSGLLYILHPVCPLETADNHRIESQSRIESILHNGYEGFQKLIEDFEDAFETETARPSA